MVKLNKIWSSKDISFATKIKLYKTLVLSTLLYGCESLTLTGDSIKRIQAFENKCYRRMLGISWKGRKTNEFVQRGIKARAGKQENLLGIVKRRKLAWFGHISRHNSLAKTVLQGTLEGGRKRGRQVKCWADNLKKMDQTEQPNPDEISRGQTCRALAVIRCVDHVSPTTPSQGTE